MNLKQVINALATNVNSSLMNASIRVVAVNSYDVEYNELFKGNVKELIDKAKDDKVVFGMGTPYEWSVVGFNYIATTTIEETLPVFIRPIEIRVI